MKLEEAKMEFVQSWGSIGSSWGIPRSMAQIHALLLANKDPLSTEDVMEKIRISRGNANTNLRELINWQLVSKQNKLGERREFFTANSDVMMMAQNIVQERKKRELQPVMELLVKLQNEELEGKEADVEHFRKLMIELDDFIKQLDQLSEIWLKLKDNFFFKKMINIMG
ncbi:transcriptional regulator [Paracrocinitomix mangrovi]|uniref:GbsR/MarR family transcriptional regulator n=1 Tax=Paracrocinitomix mangrovi TaxID=2862509 RepID=UPI001C8EEF5B|nr:transcriptional regulator [Paracrocinitomix mangrovi]UKN01046.1 transcriptional regulator [Paracrocinitomix mangrovi]